MLSLNRDRVFRTCGEKFCGAYYEASGRRKAIQSLLRAAPGGVGSVPREFGAGSEIDGRRGNRVARAQRHDAVIDGDRQRAGALGDTAGG